jgi:hypothetical protein
MQNKITEYKEPIEVTQKRELFNKVADPSNWKLPTKSFQTLNREEAEEMQDAIIFFVGGAELTSYTGYAQVHTSALVKVPLTIYTVTSKGYYHYIGA